MTKINWQEAEKNFVKIMESDENVFKAEHISLFAQNSEWDVSVYWKSGECWYVDVTTGVRKKFNKPKANGRFFLAFTEDGEKFDLFEIIHQEIRKENKMKKTLLAVFVFVLVSGSAFADVYVHGYTRQDGTYVQPHYRSDPNGTTLDNYSTKGNVNPYTGEYGTASPYKQDNSNPIYGKRQTTFDGNPMLGN